MQNFIKKYTHFIALIFLIFAGILSTNYYLNYKKSQINYFIDALDNIYLKKTLSSISNNIKPRYENYEVLVQTGDSFDKILNSLDLSKLERDKILNLLKKHKSLKNIKKNQKIIFKIDVKEPIKVLEFSTQISKTKIIKFQRNVDSDRYVYKEINKNLDKNVIYRESIIKKSLYGSAIEQNIPAGIIIEFARIYGFQIDFQRDIWKNDSFQIMYEIFTDEDNNIIDTGNILFANMNLQNKNYPLYIFKIKNGHEHFDEFGKSIRKSLMKTPINGARLSSSFGMRKHPILGFNKMHRGTDFAAPMGTPIMASGDGKVIRSRWCGGGGNCIKIKHNSTYTTVYAHLSKFASVARKGNRVKQGQTIGYVGSTGKSTGPHLHYEVIFNGTRINSQTLKLPSGKILKGKAREIFEVKKIKLDVLKSEMIAKIN